MYHACIEKRFQTLNTKLYIILNNRENIVLIIAIHLFVEFVGL